MFVDASAIIAIIGNEEDALSLFERASHADTITVSPIVIYEAKLGLARKKACPMDYAEELVVGFVEECRARIIAINEDIGRRAIAAFARYGKGRHEASLNMGDCFAYACAQAYDLPLLFKGNDFVHTDVIVA
ncbi:type II toxin-antitoxin system VapC family toxin [Rhizobium jaguaris]|uniref:type II toxin-antitoxin system VapC family toxin n=1 Tax=Rhizobium jaguaris TaxID=1312183 RepID=UPI0039BFB6B7